MDEDFNTNVRGLHCLGDSSGWTRGLMMASVMGVLMAGGWQRRSSPQETPYPNMINQGPPSEPVRRRALFPSFPAVSSPARST